MKEKKDQDRMYLKNVIWYEREKKIRTGSTSRMCSQTRCRTRGSTPTCRAAKSFLYESYFELVLLVVVSLKSSPQHLTHSGFIQDENRRLVDQCHCQRKSPLLTSAQRSHLVIESMRWFFNTWMEFMSVFILMLILVKVAFSIQSRKLSLPTLPAV